MEVSMGGKNNHLGKRWRASGCAESGVGCAGNRTIHVWGEAMVSNCGDPGERINGEKSLGRAMQIDYDDGRGQGIFRRVGCVDEKSDK